jgi:glycosyltransferase involved in cell wall biosynthesis
METLPSNSTGGKNRESKPEVSIVIPVFNYARYLGEAINSALSNKHVECEILVIDDGSTDNTADVARSYGSQIRYIYQKNQGVCAARNNGIREARAELIVFLDADDVLERDMVKHSLAALERLGDSFALVAHTMGKIGISGLPAPSHSPSTTQDMEISLLDLLIMNRFPTAVLVRKQVFSEIGYFDTDLVVSEDRDMWIRIAHRYKIWRLGTVLSANRRHDSNCSSNVDMESKCIAKVHRKALKEGYLVGLNKIYWLKIKSFYFVQFAMMLGKKSPARSLIALTLSGILWWYFPDRKELGQPLLFRTRLGIWIIRMRWLKIVM